MPRIRPINPEKYQMSKHRFYELYHFCLQYNEWKAELKYNTDTVKGVCYDGLPQGIDISDSTGELAVKRVELSEKCKLVEQTALETDPEIYQFIIKAVTNEDITFHYLKTMMDIPCGKDLYYDRRKRFYWLLSKKI